MANVVPRYNLVEFGGHFVGVKLRVKSVRKNDTQIIAVLVACCPEGHVSLEHAEDNTSDLLTCLLRGGFWKWSKKPTRLAPLSQPCSADKIKGRLFPSDDELRQTLQQLSSSSTEPDSHTATGTKARLTKLETLMEEAETSEDVHLKREIACLYVIEHFLDNVHDGLMHLTEAESYQASDFHKLIQYRRNNNGLLQHIFDSEGKKKIKEARKTAWLSQFHAAITRLLHRALDTHWMETDDPDKEDSLIRSERMPNIVIMVVHLLILEGVRAAFLICTALRANCYTFRTCRSISKCDVSNVARNIVTRLKEVDFSNVDDAVAVFCPLALVSWAMGLGRAESCELLKVKELGEVDLGISHKLENLKNAWVDKIDSPGWATESKEQKNREHAILSQDAAAALWVPLRNARRKIAERSVEVVSALQVLTPPPPSRPSEPRREIGCDSVTSDEAPGEIDIVDSTPQLEAEVAQNQLARLDTEPLSSNLPQRLDRCQEVDSGYSTDGICQTNVPQHNVTNVLRNDTTFGGWPSQDSAYDASFAPQTPQSSPVPLQSQVSALCRPSTDDTQNLASPKRRKTIPDLAINNTHWSSGRYYDPVREYPTRDVGVLGPTQLPSTLGEVSAYTSSVTEEYTAPGANCYMDLLDNCVDYEDPRWDEWFRPLDNEEST